MTYQANPNDPHRAGRSEEEMRRDNELQADPQLAEGPASGTKVAMYAIAIAVVLGVVFYGLNNNTVEQAGTTPPSETAQQTQPANPAGPSGKTNTEPGTTTGAATTNRPTPPSPNHRYGSRSQQTVKVDLPTRWDLWHAREKFADQLDKIEKKVA
jgi:uncharacterized protein HemX